MFNIESYVTPILLSYVEKYVRDFKPADAQLSLWAGGVALHNLVLKPDVLQREVSLPFTLLSGRIHELLIQVPWTKIISEPIVVTINTIECVLSLNAPTQNDEVPSPTTKPQTVETPPGYMQALVRRIVSNISLKVHHLIVKYVQDDIVLSLNVKHMSIDSAGANWEPSFADIDQTKPVLRRLVHLDDLTLCLDNSDSDGKIRFYHEPLLYRCQLDLRVLTALVSANSRLAGGLSIQLRSTKLAWSITSEQLQLLVRLIKELPKFPTSNTASPKTVPPPTPNVSLLDSSEPRRSDSWSEWAWTWLPSWTAQPTDVDSPLPSNAIPITFSAFIDDISGVIKILDSEVGARKRFKPTLEFSASYTALNTFVCSPTTFRATAGMRTFVLKAIGKCACGHINVNTGKDEPTTYCSRLRESDDEDTFEWNIDDLNDIKVETKSSYQTIQGTDDGTSSSDEGSSDTRAYYKSPLYERLDPVAFISFTHERRPPDDDPIDNPPKDFQDSDWIEDCNTHIVLQPLLFRLCTGLYHRFMNIYNICKDIIPASDTEVAMRILTVEDCDALLENLPQRRININLSGFIIRLYPWDHYSTEKTTSTLLCFDLETSKADLEITAPLYPLRVCSAASQMAEEDSTLWKAARLHISGTFRGFNAKISTSDNTKSKLCARANLKFATHILLNQHFFSSIDTVRYSSSVKIKELNISGSAPRLQAAYHICMAMVSAKPSPHFRHTSLFNDAVEDEELVALDLTLESLVLRGFKTSLMNTYIVGLESARATVIHSPEKGVTQQAWLFSAPDVPSTTFLRAACQWCEEPFPNSLDYIGFWTEPIAICIDPLFMAWLSYKPRVTLLSDSGSNVQNIKTVFSSQFFMKRRADPSSSSGRGGSRSGSGTELVHMRTHSTESASDRSEKKENTPKVTNKPKQKDSFFDSDNLLKLHERFRHGLITVELGLVLVYVTVTSASALDCPTVRLAMENHVLSNQSVMCMSVGRWLLHSNTTTRHIWQEVKHNAPTILGAPNTGEAFPWKIQFADVSCYVLVKLPEAELLARERISGLRSQLKPLLTKPRTIVELLTTVVTLSVVMKARQYKSYVKKTDAKDNPKEPEVDEKQKYFESGTEFKPTTLTEFVRGPMKNKRQQSPESKPKHPQEPDVTQKITTGPIVSIGINIHADTPPIIIRMDSDQVHLVAAAVHCIHHIISLSKSTTYVAPKDTASQSGLKSNLDQEPSSEDETENETEQLRAIFEPHRKDVSNVTTFLWFQWVISGVTVVTLSDNIKLVLDIEDIITSFDIQEEYKQLKVKVGTVSLKHFSRRDEEEWELGVLGGRIIDTSEPDNINDQKRFVNITITQAQLSSLPQSWKEQLNPKLFDKNQAIDYMWEIFVEVAPIEVLLNTKILNHLVDLAKDIVLKADCPLQKQTEVSKRNTFYQWPFCYASADGIRVVIPIENDEYTHDTIMIMCGKVSVNPHPNNPMSRRHVSDLFDSNLSGPGNFEGRQYETVIKSFSIRSVRFSQLVYHESSDEELSHTIDINPALKWNKPLKLPDIMVIVHSMDISILLAPSLFLGSVLTCGPGMEINLISDCKIDITICQLNLLLNVTSEFKSALNKLNKCLSAKNKCAYSTLFTSRLTAEESDSLGNVSLTDTDVKKTRPDLNPSVAGDSGVEISSSHKKAVSIPCLETSAETNDYFELYVTMGTVDISLRTFYGKEMTEPSNTNTADKEDHTSIKTLYEFSKPTSSKKTKSQPACRRRSLTEESREPDKGAINLQNTNASPDEANYKKILMKLMHFTLQQPNFYYWKKKAQQTIQASMFNVWAGLGSAPTEDFWHQVILSTGVGKLDPITEIPPSLFTMKMVLTGGGAVSYYSINASNRGSIQIDIDRPIQLQMDIETLGLLKTIKNLASPLLKYFEKKTEGENLPLAYKIRRFMLLNGVETAVFKTCQVGVIGFNLTTGWDSASVQVAWGMRPDRLLIRVLITSLLAAAGPNTEYRRCMVQPFHLGVEIDAVWEAWRKVDATSCNEPTLHVGVDLDRVIVDLRPEDLAEVTEMLNDIKDLCDELPSFNREETETAQREVPMPRNVVLGMFENPDSDQYYKDDLRSGAFKITKGKAMPMAYQVMLTDNTVSWKYPHPRSITKLIALPLPGQNKELKCVLEVYNESTHRWEPHTYFILPVNDPMELCMNTQPPDAVFATTWRFRSNQTSKPDYVYEFNINKFLPRQDPLTNESKTSFGDHVSGAVGGKAEVTAEELSGVIRIDSFFSPRQLPRLKICVQISLLQLHIHNTSPRIDRKCTNLQGYYVSKPQLIAHRVLTFSMSRNAFYAELRSVAGLLYLAETNISGCILDCETGTLEQLFADIDIVAGVSVPNGNFSKSMVRLHTSGIRIGLHLSHIHTIQSLIKDWKPVIEEQHGFEQTDNVATCFDDNEDIREITMKSVAALDGRITLWLHNCCSNALRISQEETNEMIVLESGARLAYRWHNPLVVRKIRFALASSVTELRWSKGVSFVTGYYHILLEDAAKSETSPSLYLHVNVVQKGSTLVMQILGRLTVANLLRYKLHYKVRTKKEDKAEYNTVSAGEVDQESLGRSVICCANTELVLRIRFANQDAGWSGNIPLKECPKENVPWLVKVPSEGFMPFISVWCRILKARSDGSIIAMIWPLYIVRSHLPLDTDVFIVSNLNCSNSNLEQPVEDQSPPLQCVSGRGATTHLSTPGTTSARHTLSLQYRNAESPVTPDTIPLHYGVSKKSVFEKPPPVNQIHDVIEEIRLWIRRSGPVATPAWPYSVVAKYFPGCWQAASTQPRCDVRVRYESIKVGAGCSLEIHLNPVVLICNASPITLTLRAHDAAPLCKFETGTVIAPTTSILKKPFFISIEHQRETYVSGPLQVSEDIPGRYGVPDPGKLTLDHPTNFTIQNNQRVAILSMFYEIKEDISVLGIISTYTLINELKRNVLLSPMAVPNLEKNPETLNPKTGLLVPPNTRGRIFGTPISNYWLSERWRGTDASSLFLFFCFSFPNGDGSSWDPIQNPIPVRIAEGTSRRTISLFDIDRKSVPVVVTQQRFEGRWIITIAKDPCPQFFIENNTIYIIAMGEPKTNNPDNETNLLGHEMKTVDECPGIKWYSCIGPYGTIFYSSPSYNASYPAAPEIRASNSFLTFSMIADLKETRVPVPICWHPISITEGEQLLQLDRDNVIKIRIRINPHSTSIKLLMVDQDDLSASDIRRRLASPSTSASVAPPAKQDTKADTSMSALARTLAEDKLVLKSNAALAALALKIQGKESGLEIYSSTSRLATTDTSRINRETLKQEIIRKVSPTEPTVANMEDEDQPEYTIDKDSEVVSEMTIAPPNTLPSDTTYKPPDIVVGEQKLSEQLRCVISSLSIELTANAESPPLIALNINRSVIQLHSQPTKMKLTASISDLQIENLQYESGQYDFSVIASTGAGPSQPVSRPALWTLFAEQQAFCKSAENCNVVINTCFDRWDVAGNNCHELTEVGIRIGSLALYIEDAYFKALMDMFRLVLPAPRSTEVTIVMSDALALQQPLRLRSLIIHPIDLTLTLHTAVRMYIALDQSPLHLGAFELQDIMTTKERLVHALTVHYLSAAILGAGWVVGGLELLGAPGALAARVGGARGGVRGLASATAAALVRSLSAWAGSLARNLDILAGDEEHSRRAAAARRRPPDSLIAGLTAGLSNFVINILGAVGGLAHHPLVGVAVGETDSGALALRRSLVGALTKPLSATADLVAYAGHGLLRQTGWDPTPEPWLSWRQREGATSGWQRDCVRWQFKLPDIDIINGFEVLLNNEQTLLILTRKYLVLADPVTEHISEMIDLQFCKLRPYRGPIVEVQVSMGLAGRGETRNLDEDDFRVNSVAWARVARYTGTDTGIEVEGGAGEGRVLSMLPAPGQSYALYAGISALINHNLSTHFSLM